MLSDADVIWGCSHCKMDTLLAELREIRTLKQSVVELKSELTSFKSTVSEKLDALANRGPMPDLQPAAAQPDFEQQVAVQLEVAERKEKKNRSVLFGLPEQAAGSPDNADLLEVHGLCQKMGIKSSSVLAVWRDGARRPDKDRILKISWGNAEDRLCFMKKIRGLRPPREDPNQHYSKVWSRPDLTYVQRQADFKLRQEYRRRVNAGEQNIYLKGGAIHVKELSVQGE